MKPIAITPGEPAGIGPDLCVKISPQPDRPIVIIADNDLMCDRACQLGMVFDVPLFDTDTKPPPVSIMPVNLTRPSKCGVLDKRNVDYVLKSLKLAVTGCMNGSFSGIVTGPVHKGIINEAGIKFKGHTEYIAEQTETPVPVMMLVTPGLRVALVTTHIPLKHVANAITTDSLTSIIQVLRHDLTRRYGIGAPRIAVCGLNPHAGEGGHLGHEEIDIIIPALKLARAGGIDVVGPLPADTVFTSRQLKQYDVVLAMYHDQGLPVIKHKGFHDAVNVTLGLPIIRTSVDHGTALDLAGTGQADGTSLSAALDEAQRLIKTDS